MPAAHRYFFTAIGSRRIRQSEEGCSFVSPAHHHHHPPPQLPDPRVLTLQVPRQNPSAHFFLFEAARLVRAPRASSRSATITINVGKMSDATPAEVSALAQRIRDVYGECPSDAVLRKKLLQSHRDSELSQTPAFHATLDELEHCNPLYRGLREQPPPPFTLLVDCFQDAVRGAFGVFPLAACASAAVCACS
jgi:hypothetical protein